MRDSGIVFTGDEYYFTRLMTQNKCENWQTVDCTDVYKV